MKSLLIELGKEQKGLLETRRWKLDKQNKVIKTDCTLLDIYIYFWAIANILIAIYGFLTFNINILFILLIIGLIGLYFIIRIDEKIMSNSRSNL